MPCDGAEVDDLHPCLHQAGLGRLADHRGDHSCGAGGVVERDGVDTSIYLGEFDSGDLSDTDPKSLCVVTKAGFIEVIPPAGPNGLSFYDMVNLEGECSLQVIPAKDE